MKKFIVLASLLCMFTVSFAQYALNLTYQFGVAGKDLYSGTMKNSMLGVNAKFAYLYDDYLRLSLGTGFYAMPYEKLMVDGVQTPVNDVTINVIPVTLGAEFTFIDQRPESKQKIKPYVGLDIGYAFVMQNESAYAPASTKGNFMVAPAFGATYGLTNEIMLNASIRNNFLIYEYRSLNEYYEIYSLLGINIGAIYTF